MQYGVLAVVRAVPLRQEDLARGSSPASDRACKTGQPSCISFSAAPPSQTIRGANRSPPLILARVAV